MFYVETYLENAAFFLKLKTERTTAFIVKQRKYGRVPVSRSKPVQKYKLTDSKMRTSTEKA